MLLSVSSSLSDNDAHHLNFVVQTVGSIQDVGAILIGKRHWSPIIWHSGYRKGADFQSCELAVYDFDDGRWSAAHAASYFDDLGLSYIIGATRSHQIAKGNAPPCDRFRVVVPFSRAITDLATYRFNMRALLQAVPADQACTDGARKYRPGGAVLAWSDGKSLVPMSTPPPPDPALVAARLKKMKITGELPRWVYDCLAGNVPEGQRNATCFRLAANMVKYGVPDDTIVRMVVGSGITLPDLEKEHAARSGIRAARGR